jgi:ABC-type glycerol-3-phosphate transport system substrate-binding protein
MPFARSRMTRRHMLAGTGGVLGALALAACGQAMPADTGEMPEKAEEETKQTEEVPVAEKAAVGVKWISNDLSLVEPFYEKLLVPSFNENYPNIELNWVVDTYSKTMEQLRVQLPAGEAPDVFHNDGVFFAQYRDVGYARAITEYVQRDSGQLQGVRGPEFFTDEKQDVYGVSMGVGCAAFAYNTDIFDRFGINRLPAEGIDWNPGDGGTLLELASDITGKGQNEDPRIWGWFNNKQATFDILGMLLQNGTNFLTDDYRRSRAHEAEFIAVIQFLWDLEFKHRVAPNPDERADFNATIPENSGYHGPFAWQRSAMMNLGLGQSGSWGSPDPESLPIVAVQYIHGPANNKVPGGGRVVEMWGSTEVPDEAWEVMKFPLLDHEVQVGVFSILRDGLPANTNTWDDARLLELSGRPPREVEAYMAPLREGRGQYWQVNGVWLEWRSAFRGAMNRAWALEVTVEEAMQQASKESQAVLDEYYANQG